MLLLSYFEYHNKVNIKEEKIISHLAMTSITHTLKRRPVLVL